MKVGSGERVLVVDDDPSTHSALLEYLRHAGYEPTGAFSGEEALEVLTTVRPDAVLLDVQMPGIDGFETLRRMQAQPGRSMHKPSHRGRHRPTTVVGQVPAVAMSSMKQRWSFGFGQSSLTWQGWPL